MAEDFFAEDFFFAVFFFDVFALDVFFLAVFVFDAFFVVVFFAPAFLAFFFFAMRMLSTRLGYGRPAFFALALAFALSDELNFFELFFEDFEADLRLRGLGLSHGAFFVDLLDDFAIVTKRAHRKEVSHVKP